MDTAPSSSAAGQARRPAPQVRGIGRAIAEWGTAGGSTSRRPDLPWRSTRDPWSVLVAEVMLQQTQVSRVVPAYERFLRRFPTPSACAASPLGEVLRAWEGLGYNRRARGVHGAAVAMVAGHGGEVPRSLSGLLALPGVGAYTARAVLAFAFEADIGVVDTNAGRVLSRAAAGATLRPVEAQGLVDSMVPVGRGWTFNQALLDLGATVCVSGTPACTPCPIRRRCRWAAAGWPLPDPARGSAGVSTRQSTFAGSDRQGRGRLIDALRRGPVSPEEATTAVGWSDDPDRVERVVAGLVAEGMVLRGPSGVLSLP
ncbi:MAG: A/G-specific adenine glycosylase [Acidimicrobiales bacterium]